MAYVSELPCDGEGICMMCKNQPPQEEMLTCKTCVTPWHAACLASSSSAAAPKTLSDTLQWECPDCAMVNPPVAVVTAAGDAASGLIAAIRAIEADKSLSEAEKARLRQEVVSGQKVVSESEKDANLKKRKMKGGDIDILSLVKEDLQCSFCMQLLDRPISISCGHNFCLKCIQKWMGLGNYTCPSCRAAIPASLSSHPRINQALVETIRKAKDSRFVNRGESKKVYHYIHNDKKPDTAYTTERAKKAGKANACSGKIWVTIAPDHFGPIPADNDPVLKEGILVGRTWTDRMECRQWGAHFPHVAGIAGQSGFGAQSVALSGGYEDDEDHGEWFLYTGSGGRDLSGNKRTNKEQSFDQAFDKSNEALRVSCRKGYPVRVVRSHKEKRSSYAPVEGVRYDGIYRIEKCWRKNGMQGFKVCRYLFVRCDNEPAPWTTDENGDRPRPLPVVEELKDAIDITERKGSPSWDYDEEEGRWMWKKPPPASRKPVPSNVLKDGEIVRIVKRQPSVSVRDRLLKEFGCQICRKVMVSPLTTPCAHNFCKACLEGAFAGQSFMRERSGGRRTLRAQKNVMKCPCCTCDIAEFLQNAQVNRELMSVIESLQRAVEEMENPEDSDEEEGDGTDENPEEPLDESAGIQEETGDDILNNQSDNKSTDGTDSSEQEAVGLSDLPDPANGKTDSNKEQTAAKINKVFEQKEAADGGMLDAAVQVGNKRAKVEVAI